jgi:hypothetical protein
VPSVRGVSSNENFALNGHETLLPDLSLRAPDQEEFHQHIFRVL